MYGKKSIILLSTVVISATSSLIANEELIKEESSSVIIFTDIQEDVNQEKVPFDKTTLPANVKFENEKEALDTDISILIQETGLPEESVRKTIAFQKSFRIYANKLLTQYPDKISSIYVEKLPAIRGHIKFVDEVPEELNLSIKELNQEDKIILTGNGKVSFKDNNKRAVALSNTLAKMKYKNVVTFFDPIKNVIQIEIKIPTNEKAPKKENLMIPLQKGLEISSLKSNAKNLTEKDIELTIIRGEGAIVTEDYSRGGSLVRDDGFSECTMGWSVSGPYGDGIITAGHCNGINQLQDHSNGNVYDTVWRSQVYNLSGDVEYHTTPISGELDDFHADSTSIRDVIDIQSTNTMVGSYVCLYGRFSNVRTCNNVVTAINVTVNADGTTQVGNLARTNNTSSIPGDSGGGWSWNNTAWGVNHGHDSAGNGYFTPVQVAESALGVTIKR